VTDALRSAEVAVVGGGIAGTAVAYYLARAGVAGVVLLERDQLGAGMTGSSFAGIRQQFSTPAEIELSKRGLRFWKHCAAELSAPCPFWQFGYLFVTTRPAVMSRLADAARLQRSMGAGPVETLRPDEVAEVAPWLATGDLAGGCYTPEDGRVMATDGVYALASAARRLGVAIRTGFPVASVTRAGRGWELAGPAGRIGASQVVVAAGLDAPELVAPLGTRVDVRPMLQHWAVTGPALDGLAVPLTIDFDTGFCVEREGPGLAVTVLRATLPPGYGRAEMLAEWSSVAAVRAPALLDQGVSQVLTAAMDDVADGHPNAGALDDGLWVLAGFAAHGVMHGPPLAELLAGVIAGRPDPDFDLAPFDPRRRPVPAGDAEWMVGHNRVAEVAASKASEWRSSRRSARQSGRDEHLAHKE
jgi:sarcosine oxidase subunit beta